MCVAVKNHALPVYKKNRIASLLCIFESIILVLLLLLNQIKTVIHDLFLLFSLSVCVISEGANNIL